MAGRPMQSQIEIAGILSPSLQQAIQQAVDRLEEMSEETLESAGAAARLADEIDAQESVLRSLQHGYADYVVSGRESSDEARQLAGWIGQLSGDLNENRQQLENAERAASQLGDAMEDAGQQAEDSSEGYTILKNVVANLATEAISKAVDAFKELATEGDNAMAMLEARTGATSSEMEGFEDVMYEVYNANYGESLGDVSEKLGTVIQMTDNLDNASLANVTKNAIALEDVFDFDVMESMRGVNSLMDQFGITSDQAFNLITQGAQKGLNQNDDLLDVINEYSVQFKNAGYSADDMFNMLANGVESGTWSVDKLGDAVKEFNIRMSDGSAKEAVEALGYSWEMISEEWNRGGDNARYLLSMIMYNLGNLENTTEKYNIGVGLMGTMYEDLGHEAVLALSNTEGAISSVSGAMAQMDSAAYDTLESSLSQLGRTVKAEVVQPIAEKLTPVMKDSVNFVNERVSPAVDWLLSHLPEFAIILGTIGSVIAAMKWGSIVTQIDKISGAFSGFKTAIAAIPGPVMAIIAIVAALAAGFMYLWDTNEEFRNNVTALWEELQGSFSELGGQISDMLNQLMPLITQVADTVLTAFGEIATAVLPILLQLISDLLPVVIDLIDQLLPALTPIIETVLTVLVDALNQLLPPIMQIITAVLPVLVQLMQTILPVIMQIVSAVLPVLIQLINALLPVIIQFIDAVLPVIVEILNALMPVLDMAISLLQPILDLLISLLQPILDLIIIAVEPLVEIFVSFISDALKPLIPTIQAIADMFTTVLSGAINAVMPIVQSITDTFSGLIEFITGVFTGNWDQAWNGIVDTLKGILNQVPAIVEGAINGAIAIINGIISGVNKITGVIGISAIPEIQSVTLPRFAEGGFTDGPSLAGEAGMEAVISFDKRYHSENVAIWEKAGQMLGTLGTSTGEGAGLVSTAGKLLTLDDFSLGSLANDASTIIYYDFSGFTWSPQIQTGTTGNDTDDFMAQLRAHEAEFFDWLDEFIHMREVAQYA